MRYFIAVYILLIVAVISIAGFRGSISRKPPLEVFPDMDRQYKLRPQAPNDFFANQRSSQRFVEGTVARGSAYQDNEWNSGQISGTTNFVALIPFGGEAAASELSTAMMERGRQRFEIYCLPCHGAVGDGKGVTSKYGILNSVSFHDPRIVAMPDGEIFNTITHGKNTMGPYGANIKIDDRWAIVAYVRALQRSRLGALADVPEENRSSLSAEQ